MTDKLFGWLDYFIFGSMLLLSALIGVYFAFIPKQKQNTPLEYLLGGKSIGVFPISMSLIASYISAISLIGIPAEIYVYGTQYWTVIISEYLVCITVAKLSLPVFYKLQITSSYEYLNLRFDGKVRTLGSCLFIIKMLLYLPIVVYVPSLSFSQVTGINLYLTTAIVCIICTFYTTLGGLKAVVWTDTLQLGAMLIGIISVIIIGVEQVGISNIFQRNYVSNRFEFDNFDLDPTVRHTVWGLFIGNYFYWLANCTVNQAIVQRYLAMPNIKKANISMYYFVIGVTFLVSTSCITGLIIFAYYYNCDPLTTKKIRKADQILPYFVMEISSTLPGLPGLFISGVFSAALSSMSSGLNSMTGVIFEDILKPFMGPVSDAKASFIMKTIVVIIGAFCMAMVFLVDKLGAIIQAGKTLSSITGGPLLGVFALGMVFPWANAEGAFLGGICGLIVIAVISFSSQYAIANGDIKYETKPFSTEACPANKDLFEALTQKSHDYIDSSNSAPLWILRVSYTWYAIIGCFTVIIVGMLVSYFYGFNDPRAVDKDLIIPVVHKCICGTEKKVNTPTEVEDKL